MLTRRVKLVIGTSLAWSLTLAYADPPQYFDCQRTSYVHEECAATSLPDQHLRPPTPAPPEELPPLFTPGTVARDTPPLMLALLNDPTPENLERYLAWNTRRMERALYVEKMLQAATRKGQ